MAENALHFLVRQGNERGSSIRRRNDWHRTFLRRLYFYDDACRAYAVAYFPAIGRQAQIHVHGSTFLTEPATCPGSQDQS